MDLNNFPLSVCYKKMSQWKIVLFACFFVKEKNSYGSFSSANTPDMKFWSWFKWVGHLHLHLHIKWISLQVGASWSKLEEVGASWRYIIVQSTDFTRLVCLLLENRSQMMEWMRFWIWSQVKAFQAPQRGVNHLEKFKLDRLQFLTLVS